MPKKQAAKKLTTGSVTAHEAALYINTELKSDKTAVVDGVEVEKVRLSVGYVDFLAGHVVMRKAWNDKVELKEEDASDMQDSDQFDDVERRNPRGVTVLHDVNDPKDTLAGIVNVPGDGLVAGPANPLKL